MSLLSRLLTPSILSKKSNVCYERTNLFSTCISSSSAAEKFLTHLQNNNSKNVEKNLYKVKATLDVPCVNEVLKKCVFDNNPEMGLRFFIWAGMQKSSYRHSSYMYNKACKLLKINENPKIINNVFESYKVEDSGIISVKMFKIVLSLCKEVKDAKLGLWVLRKMKEFNCRPDTVAYNVIIRLFCEKGEMNEAIELMKEMSLIDLYPDMITYVSMIKGLCEIGKIEEACELVKDMRAHKCPINVVIFTSLIDAICKFGSIEKALEILSEMEQESIDCKPNVVTYTALIKGFVEKKRSIDALTILDRISGSGLTLNRTTIATLINGLCVEGYVDEVYKVINKTGLHNECYSSLVLSLWRIGKKNEAELIFDKMMGKGLKPDGVASSIVINGLCLEGRFLDGFKLYDKLEKSGFVTTIDSDIFSTLLVGLCDGDYLVEGVNLARVMIEKRIKVKECYVNKVVKCLKDSGELELANTIAGMVNE